MPAATQSPGVQNRRVVRISGTAVLQAAESAVHSRTCDPATTQTQRSRCCAGSTAGISAAFVRKAAGGHQGAAPGGAIPVAARSTAAIVMQRRPGPGGRAGFSAAP